MKKHSLLGVIMAIFTHTAMATEQIKIVWPFGPVAATQSMRATIDQANQDQKDFTFLMDFKTGGGGSIAVESVSTDKNNSILASSASFFINPLLDSSAATYNTSDYRMIDYLCDLPFVVASKKYKSFKEIKKNEPITLGHLGIGTTTHAVAEAIRKKYPNMVLVPYKTATQAGTDLMGNHVDLIVSLPGDTFTHHKAGSLTVLAVTGSQPVENVPTLLSFNIPESDKLVSGYFYFTHKSTDETRVKKWQAILKKAKTEEVNAIMSRNYCRPSTVTTSQYDEKFNQYREFWAKEIQTIKK